MTQAELLPLAAAPEAIQSQRLQLLIEPDVRELRPHSALCLGAALADQSDSLAAGLGISRVRHVTRLDGGTPADHQADLVLCAGLLERTPVAELDPLLQRLRSLSENVVFQISTCARPLAGESPNCTVRYADWWRPKLRQFFDCVEMVEISAGDVVFKTWPWSRLQAPLRIWRQARSRGKLRQMSTALRAGRESDLDRPATPTCLACEAGSPDYLGEKNGYHVWQCGQCRLLFVDPMPSPAQIDEFYSQHPRNDKYLRKCDGKYRRARWRLTRLKRLVAGRRFLDIGCSIGSSVEAARDAGFDATGIDLDPQSIEFAARHYPRCRFRQCSSADLARAGEKFDLIFCTEVIEHVTMPQAFVDDLRALLNPGGVVFLTTPHGTHFRLPRDILTWYGLKPPEHIVLFGRRSITALFERRGLEVLSAPLRLKTTLKVVARRAA